MRIKHTDLPMKRSALWFVASIAFVSNALAQQNPNLQIDVTGSRESSNSILTPTKILQGNELQDKLSSTLGGTIGNELGVSQTGYAAGASRPVMRGLEGARVQILQNGLAVGDLSALSPDHATASAIANARQIEIGALRTGYESVSNGRAASGVVEASHGSIALHVDTSINNNQHYRFPGNSALNGKTDWSVAGLSGVNRTGKLRNSFDNSNDLGVGASLVHTSGYTGVSVERLNREYGVPTVEGGKLQLGQSRYDFKHETRDPFSG
ncbi:MAG: Plug domain-containing protein, partial [Burkholderiaceae bacterium]|nr:Plug domain-containing protein [Burkholderiaceae bacterium]